MTTVTLRQLVAEQRTSLGMSLRDVADRSGGLLSSSTVHAIETGRRTTVSDETVDGLAKAFRVPVSLVRDAAGYADADVTEPFKLPRKANRLTRRERDHVLELIDLLLERRSR